MIGWLIGIIRKRRWQKQRLIYRYFDGERIRAADPMQLWAALLDDKEFTFDQLPLLDQGDVKTAISVAGAVRRVFGVKELADGGLTNQECNTLLVDYFDYAGTLKKNTSEIPTSPPPTTELPSSEKSTTPPDSASISIEIEQKPVSL